MIETYISHGRHRSVGYKCNASDRYIGRFRLYRKQGRYEIWSLEVDYPYRNKGHATQMLTEFLSKFKSTKPLVLYVTKGNKVAIHLYEKVGFVIIGEEDFRDGCVSLSAYKMQYKPA